MDKIPEYLAKHIQESRDDLPLITNHKPESNKYPMAYIILTIDFNANSHMIGYRMG